MMKKYKVCFMQTNAYSLFTKSKHSIHGGSELQLYFLAKELAQNKKFKVSFLVGDFNQKNIETIDDVTLYKTVNPDSGKQYFAKLLQAMKYYFILKKIDADVYFTSAANSTVGLVSFFCKIHRKKHIHRTASERDVNFKWIKDNSILGYVYKWGLEHSDLVLTQANEHKILLKKNHNIDAVIFKNIMDINTNENEEKEFILWVSRYAKLKNPNVFVNLAKNFPEQKFVMICPTQKPSKEYDKLQKNAQDVKNLQFIKYVPFNKIQFYFNKAKVFVNTSDFEGFPNTFLQSFLGKTAILSLNVNPDEIIRKYGLGYFCGGDSNKLEEGLEVLLKNKSYLKAGEEGLRYLKNNHSIKHGTKKLIKLITQLDERNN